MTAPDLSSRRRLLGAMIAIAAGVVVAVGVATHQARVGRAIALPLPAPTAWYWRAPRPNTRRAVPAS